jgi:hypothetical protein
MTKQTTTMPTFNYEDLSRESVPTAMFITVSGLSTCQIRQTKPSSRFRTPDETAADVYIWALVCAQHSPLARHQGTVWAADYGVHAADAIRCHRIARDINSAIAKSNG